MLRPQFIHKKGHCGHGPKIFQNNAPPPSSNTNKETHTPTNSAKNIHTYTDTQEGHTPIKTHIHDHSHTFTETHTFTLTHSNTFRYSEKPSNIAKDPDTHTHTHI